MTCCVSLLSLSTIDPRYFSHPLTNCATTLSRNWQRNAFDRLQKPFRKYSNANLANWQTKLSVIGAVGNKQQAAAESKLRTTYSLELESLDVPKRGICRVICENRVRHSWDCAEAAKRAAMTTKPVTITLTRSSSLFQKLGATLQRQGMLRRVLSLDRDDLEIFDPNGQENLKLVHRYAYYKRVHRIFWGIWRRLPGSSLSRTLPAVFLNTLADWLFSRWIPCSTIYHGCTGVCLISLRKARRLGAIVMIENATMHARDWQKAVVEECNAFGVRRRDCRAVLPSLLFWRLEREYERCDYIIVPSPIARQSFAAAGLHEKAIVVHAGVDHHFFIPPAVFDPQSLFRVCYVGRVELAKGVPYLLQAWKQLDLANAELVLVGEIAPEMNSVIKEFALPNVRFTGSLASSQVADCYRASHLFAFPSVNEGLARVLFEAMASGLPVVATEKSGAEDLITKAVEGTIVPARDAAALAEAILWHCRNPQASAAMGKAARAKVEQQFTLAHYAGAHDWRLSVRSRKRGCLCA